MAILAKEMAAINKMSLSELRTLDPDAPIIEKDDEPLPGTVPDAGMPPPDAGMPPMEEPGGMAGPPPGGAEPPLPPM
jgi:hypothetical protein